jgi:predicted ATPase
MVSGSWALWLLGYPHQALKRSSESLALADKLTHPPTLATDAAFVACLQQMCGNVRTVEELSTTAIAISTEHDFAYYRTMAIILRGWALFQRGQEAEGIGEMRQGVEAFQAMGGVLLTSYFSGLLAEAYVTAAQAEEGLNILRRVDNDMEPWWKAELYRLKGELRLRQRELEILRHADQEEAAEYFHQAVAIARAQKAKSLELRATMSLCRLWLQQSKRSEARRALAEIYGWFTEGFDTKDLREAKALLEELT